MIKQTIYIYGHLFWRTFVLLVAYFFLYEVGIEIPYGISMLIISMVSIYWCMSNHIIKYLPPAERYGQRQQ